MKNRIYNIFHALTPILVNEVTDSGKIIYDIKNTKKNITPRRPNCKFKKKHHNNKSSDLLIVRLDAIGDFILWLDSAKKYRRLYPEQKITLIANNVWADFARHFPYWDEVWPVETKQFAGNFLYRWKTLCKIRWAGFDMAIQPTFSRVFSLGDIIIRASGATKRIGSIGDLSNLSIYEKETADNWYTKLIPATHQPLMELDRNAEFISNLSEKRFSASLPKLPVLIDLPTHLKLQTDYIIVFPGASWPGRQWPINYFIQLLDTINNYHKCHIVLCGSSAEFDLCQSIANSVKIETLNLAGKTSLAEFAELTRGARLMIANETSAIHIANAVDTPSVCILGGGHYGRFLPYPEQLKGLKPLVVAHKMPCFNCNWQCTLPHDSAQAVPCISAVTVDDVLSTALGLLKEPKLGKMRCTQRA